MRPGDKYVPASKLTNGGAAAALLLAIALGGENALAAVGMQTEPAAPCCGIVSVQPDPGQPCCSLVTARNARTGQTFRFRVEGALRNSLRVGQAVGLDASGRSALVGGQSLSVLPAVDPTFAAPIAGAAPTGSAGATGSAATSGGSDAARVRALEARIAELEGRGAAPAAIPCTALSVNGSGFPAGTTLTVTVNGATAGVFSDYAGRELEDFMQPGPNTVVLSFSDPGTPGVMGTQAELRCLPPGSVTSRNEIVRLRPVAGRLSAQTQVNFVR